MPRLVVLSDIHGNLPAFEAVLADAAADSPDRLVCLGDVAALGPQPREVIARLRELGCLVVMGNTDASLADPSPVEPEDPRQRRLLDWQRWGADQLSADDRAFLRSFAPTVELPLGDGRTILCYHGSPRSFDEPVLPTTPTEELDRLLGSHPALLFAGGHTHQQMLRRHHRRLVLNPGAVGLARAEVPFAVPAPFARWAEYAVLHLEGDRLGVELRRVPYDVAALLAAGTRAGLPHGAAWAEQWQPTG